MTDELERRLRTGFSNAALPAAPDSLHAALDRLPNDAGPIGTGVAPRLPAGFLVGVAAAVVIAILAASVLAGGIIRPPRNAPSPFPASPTVATSLLAATTPRPPLLQLQADPGRR
jgi:hypothetical protein